MNDLFEAHVEGHEKVIAGLGLAAERGHDAVEDFLDELGMYAQFTMLLYVGGKRRLVAKLDRSRTTSVGDRMEKKVGVRGPQVWPWYVHGGTGIYGPTGTHITARDDRGPASVINTHRRRLTKPQGGVMRFIGRGGAVYYRRSVAGQKANPFVERAWEATKIYGAGRIHTVGNKITR